MIKCVQDFSQHRAWKAVKSVFLVILTLALMTLLTGCKAELWDPKGMVAAEEKQLFIIATLLMLIVVIPVLIMTAIFSWRFRASNTKEKYRPDWSHSTLLEIIWWGVPIILIIILAVLTWVSSFRLDPYRPLDVAGKPVTIQAISLNWKWLFIYPEQNIATVNFIQFPAHRQIRFLITSDAPMNSFAIPQLAGQIYAMEGMQTKLHLIANETGEFNGRSTNYSGNGFSGMKFIAKASTQKEFDQWVRKVKASPSQLTMKAYDQLIMPTKNHQVEYYSTVTKGLFHKVIMKFMSPEAHNLKNSKEAWQKENANL
ncbi:Ubiquinol oxidase subunit 2 precursor [Piscirickettsia salmonis]|uniref:ubiquinol oxidase subunit II n=1 Tax=Piscirickettsia salmonis TaxID=1238 RepID=UPI0012B9DC3C|nr:ubiquinol oxidase subunit II [Piscirickettsia salmonis]QGP50151.1 Ubiquinol oxidase subunit 2 precursor [Piscirickettsia salmonis]QGP54608.1 Ubiquinol oxidase subunit 2 precursor [Piscirickettsia salmonis]QGP59495.1 Ubiquinol oxidase subunit 2 precursor [Piscirickettsia salmonis]QGP64192.1 Ubiquinol oxidase subunit 2 precursor [Piscirickettsia salmonis]